MKKLVVGWVLMAPTLALAGPELPPASPKKAEASLLAAVDDITRQVVALRGLARVRPVAAGILSREAIGQKLRERIAQEYTEEEIRTEARVLKRLGLLPADVDYPRLLIDLLMEQVAGFYDPFARQLYVANWLALDVQRPALAHEIEHALQDQHFDLKKFALPLKEEGDRQLARSAVVEGDGTVVMLEFSAQALGLKIDELPSKIDALGERLATGSFAAAPVFDKAPRFLRETLLFPYLGGMKFVLSMRRQAWSQVDALFMSPPESTEQILHPQKYLAKEHPVSITAAPIAALAPQRELRRDVIGELEWQALLATRLSDATSRRAAEGWGGDRLVAYGADDGPVAVVNLSTWDSDQDAEELEAAMRKWLARTTRQHERAPGEAAIHVMGGDAWSIERRGRAVLTLFGVPKDRRGAIADQVWGQWAIGKPQPTSK